MQRVCRTFPYPRGAFLDDIAECKRVDQVKRVHARIIVAGLDQCSVVQAKLLRKLAELGVPMQSYAHPVFDRVADPNPFLWTALIRGYALEGRLSVSAGIYCRMRSSGETPLSFTFSTLFKACGVDGDVDLGRALHGQTISLGGFESDLHVGNSLTDMYAKCEEMKSARKVLDEMPARDSVSWTQMIVRCWRNGDIGAAEALFRESTERDSVAWTAMITGYVQNSLPRAALNAFDQMREEGSEIDDVTLVGVISACASLGLSKQAKWVHLVAETSGFGPAENVFVGSAMVDMYSKCGDLDEAVKVFSTMKTRNAFTYGSMISGFGSHGRAREAMLSFHEMLSSGIEPNGTTFLALLGAFRNSGLTVPGKALFASMEKLHRIAPGVEHYACLVGLLGRAGKLEEALSLIAKMPMSPNGPVWGALLSACGTHKSVEIAEVAADQLFELEPREAGNYALLSSIYASVGKWERVSRVRRRIDPGYSWVETRRGEIRTFVPMDRTVHGPLGRVEGHSEKLALEFGLANSGPGEAVKIMKSMRMCEDCHAVMSGASLVTGREIVVRDSVRFHCFQDGFCSCGNYW